MSHCDVRKPLAFQDKNGGLLLLGNNFIPSAPSSRTKVLNFSGVGRYLVSLFLFSFFFKQGIKRSVIIQLP